MKKLRMGMAGLMVFLFAGFVQAQSMDPVPLSPPEFHRGKLLMEALKERKSSRAFSPKELPMDVLSNLLWAAHGVNRPESGKRTAPSAKNLQEIDLYVATQKGLYLYDTANHLLAPVHAEDIRIFTGMQDFTQIAPVNLIYVADYSRMDKNGDNNAFYSAADTGYVSQNVYLFCASEGLSTVVLGWVDKPQLKERMQIKEHQKIILTQPVGYPAE